MEYYVLFRYNLTGEEELTCISEDQLMIVKEALQRSKNDCENFYRLENWIDDILKYPFRYFKNGKETTDEIKSLILNGIQSTYKRDCQNMQ
jgi:hypothetical protein